MHVCTGTHPKQKGVITERKIILSETYPKTEGLTVHLSLRDLGCH